MEREDDALGPVPPFTVGDWLAEPMANQLTYGETVSRVEPKVMEVLVCLARQPGRTVTREQFMEEVWTGTVVTDDVLARCISELRKTLGDEARHPRYVETIRKRGYRLIAPVAPAAVEPAAAFSSPEPAGLAAPPASADAPAQGAQAAQVEEEMASAPPPSVPAMPERPVVQLAPRRAVRPLRRLAARPAARLAARSLRRRQGRYAVALALVLTLGAVAAVQHYVSTRLRPLTVVPITSFPGEETDPALSPDGRAVAFAWDAGRGYNFDLYVQATVDEPPLQLARGDADEFSPAWSPDGRRLAFARCTDGGCGVFLVPARGGEEQELADLRPLHVRDLVWSPDGQTLALSARREEKGAYGVVLLPLSTRTPLRLTESPASPPGDLDPAWSPDGRSLAFVRTTVDGRQDVCVAPVEGGEVHCLAREQQGVTGLDWAADGRSVVYAANRDGAAGLWRVRATGGAPVWVAVAQAGGEVYQPSVAREGRGITFAQRTYQTNIAEVVLSGGGARAPQPLIASTRWDSHPAVSADGERIAFVSTRTGYPEVWTADADGVDLERLTSFGGPRVSTPRWSPDGGTLVFAARTSGNADLYLVEPGLPPRRLTDDPGDEVAPSWSRDGRTIYFASRRNGDWQIWRKPAGGGEAIPVTRYGGIAAEETPDGGALLVVRPDRLHLWRIPLERDLPEQHAEPIAPLNPADWANWTVYEEGVYVVQRHEDGETADVVLVDLETRERQRIATVERLPQDPSLAVFPGGRRLLVTQIERSDSDIVLVRDFH